MTTPSQNQAASTALPGSPFSDDFAVSARPPSWSSSSQPASPDSITKPQLEPDRSASPSDPQSRRRSPSESLSRTFPKLQTQTPQNLPGPTSPDSPPPKLQRRVSLRFPIKLNTDPNFSPEASPASRARTRSTSKPERPSRQELKRSVSSLGEIPLLLANNPNAPSPQNPTSSSSSQIIQEAVEPVSTLPFTYTPVMSAPAKSSMDTTTSNAPAYTQQGAPSRMQPGLPVPMPNLSGQANGLVGNLLKGPVDAQGRLKDAALMVGIKMDLEAEIHLTARVRGDILVGLY